MKKKAVHFAVSRSIIALVCTAPAMICAAQSVVADESAAMGALKVAKHYYDKGAFKNTS